MLEGIANIEEYLSGVDQYEMFAANKLLCHGVVYNLQCIGEGVYMLSTDFKNNHPEMDWDTIEGLRHVLVHDYYLVNIERVWRIIQQDLQPLKAYLSSL